MIKSIIKKLVSMFEVKREAYYQIAYVKGRFYVLVDGLVIPAERYSFA